MNKKQKVIDAYLKTSTPQEIMYDVLEKMQGMKDEFGVMRSRIETDVRDEDSIREIILPLVPDVRDGIDGRTPSVDELIALITPLIPELKDGADGKDGSPDSPVEIREKLKSLKGKNKLSVFDLKDTEYLREGKGMQWSSAGFKVYTDTTLTGDGSFNNPLHAIGGGSSTWYNGEQITLAGDNKTFTLAHAPSSTIFPFVDRQPQIYNLDFTGTINGINKTFVFTVAIPSSLLLLVYSNYA